MEKTRVTKSLGVLNVAVAAGLAIAGAAAMLRMSSTGWNSGERLIAWLLIVGPLIVLAAGGVGLCLGQEWGRRWTVGYALFGIAAHVTMVAIYYVTMVNPSLGQGTQEADVRQFLLLGALAAPTLVYDIFLLAVLLRTKISIIARRELASVFTSPLAYLAGAGFLLVVGILFMQSFDNRMEASLRQPFTGLVTALVLAIPLLTMPLLSEEYSRGTIETMLTAPVSEIDLTLGKFLGVLGFYLMLLAATVPHFVVLIIYGKPHISQALVGYFGMVLVGAMFLSVGLFFSSVTRHQMMAAVLSALVLAAVTVLPEGVDPLVTGNLNAFFRHVSVLRNFTPLSQGIMDTRPVVLFVSVTVYFLFLSVKVLESRRWR